MGSGGQLFIHTWNVPRNFSLACCVLMKSHKVTMLFDLSITLSKSSDFSFVSILSFTPSVPGDLFLLCRIILCIIDFVLKVVEND